MTLVITEPNEVSYSNNPIIVKAESEQLATFDGARYSLTFTFPVDISGGTPVVKYDSNDVITFAGVSITFVDTEAEANETSCFLDSDIQNFIDCFNNISDLKDKYFAQRVDYNTVKIIALFKGSIYNNVFFTSTAISGSIVVNSESLGTDSYFGETKTDYGVFCEVYEGEVSDFRNITTPEKNNFLKRADLLINFRSNNQYEFNLSEVLRTYLNYELPDLSAVALQRVGNQIGFFCRVGEVYRVNDTFRKRAFDSETTPKAVILGAVDLLDSNDASVHYNGQSMTLADCKPFYRNQSFYTFAFLKGTTESFGLVRVRINLYFFDGTSATGTLGTIPRPSQNGVYYYLFDTGKLDIEGKEITQGAGLEYFEIFVDDTDGNTLVNPVSYEVQDEPKYHKLIAYRNRYGVIDHYSFAGQYKEGVSSSRRTFEKYYPLSPESSDFNLAVFETKTNKQYNYASSWIRKTEFESLIDLVKSKEVYEVIGTEYHAIVPGGFGYEYNSETDLYQVSFSAVRTISENSL